MNDRIAVVTGGSRGIGAAIARRLGKEGATVVVNYAQSGEAAKRIVDEIRAIGGKAEAIQADVSKPEDVTRLIDQVVEGHGRIDILVNNAGVAEFGALEAVNEDHITRQFGVNVTGLLLTTKAAAAHFPESGGSVVNISSVVGVRPMPNASAYSATKAAVDAVSKSLARELGPRRIRVNSVSPGPVETDMLNQAADEATRSYFLSLVPLGRLGQPEDIANTVAFIASDEASWITGQTLGVDGGIQG
ncbi:MAG TPA: 3-oxoacyl-ACP reductase family protein [Fimbriimonadaceae bacterium]|nr:3-oxoacyl-ACP reductase family protein [Fimbriimonadaceae bacterium]